jgi:hypothetical protein
MCLQSGAGRLRWAIAGRDAAKLEEVKKGLVAIDPSCKVTQQNLPNSNRGLFRVRGKGMGRVLTTRSGTTCPTCSHVLRQSECVLMLEASTFVHASIGVKDCLDFITLTTCKIEDSDGGAMLMMLREHAVKGSIKRFGLTRKQVLFLPY